MGNTVHAQGDARISLLCPVEVVAEPIPAERAHATRSTASPSPHWELTTAPAPSVGFSRGSLTYVEREPFHLAARAILSDVGIIDAALLEGGIDEMRASTVELIRTRDGAMGLRCDLAIPDGWGAGRHAQRLWSSTRRDESARVIREALTGALAGVLTDLGESGHPFIPFFHVVLAGRTAHAEPGRHPLDDDLRDLIYPPEAGPTTSDSPDHTEFVHAGYGFSLHLVSEGAEYRERLDSYVQLVQLTQHLYRSAALLCDRVEADLANLDEAEQVRARHRIRATFLLLKAPTLTFQHRLLVLRDRLVDEWRVVDLIHRAEFLVGWLEEELEARAAERERRRALLTRWGIGILTVLSIFEIADSAASLLDRF